MQRGRDPIELEMLFSSFANGNSESSGKTVQVICPFTGHHCESIILTLHAG